LWVILLPACEEVLSVVGRIASIELSPANPSVNLGDSIQFTAVAKDSAGNTITTSGNAPISISWTSSNLTVASISTTGLARGLEAGTSIITASAEGVTRQTTLTVVAVPPVVQSVQVTPANPSIAVGDSVQLTATARDGSGNVVPGVAVTWSSSDTTKVRVSSSGRARGIAAGSAVVSATAGGVTGQTTVTVTAAPPSADSVPDVSVDFSQYANHQAFVNDTTLFFESENLQFIVLDTTVGYGTSTKSMRVTYPDRTSDPNRCSSITIRRRVNLTTAQLPNGAPEVWYELWARLDTNFTTRAPTAWACPSNPDLKFLLMGGATEGRYEVLYGNGGTKWAFNFPGGGALGERVWRFSEHPESEWSDGQWHRLRVHLKNSTTSTSANGQFQVWLDDVKVVDTTGINTTTPQGAVYGNIQGLTLANLNQGPGAPQSLWWGRIRAWYRHPGW
jgi:hypothetical protein